MKNPLYQAVFAIGCSLLAPAIQAAETVAPGADDYRTLNLALVDNHVIPRYAALAQATDLLDGHARAYCESGEPQAYEALQGSWRESVDAWQDVQHIRFGPVELFMRSMRLSYWPDPRNTVGRQLDELVSSRDRAAIAPDAFSQRTISVQGFPALERLIPGIAVSAPGDDASEADFRCALMQAVAHNVASMAADTLDEWRGGERPYRDVIASADSGQAHYQAHREATQDLFKSLHGSLELVAEHKLARPLGASRAGARPQLAEASRSQRSLENIRINLAAAEAFYLGDGGEGFTHFVRKHASEPELDDLLRRAFAQTRASAEAIGLPLEEAIEDPVERGKVEKLAREAAALKALLAQRLTVAMGIPLGFNSLDGD